MATPDPAVEPAPEGEVVEEPVAEPAPETVDETTTTTTTPGEEPVGDPTNEPAPTTTNPPAAEPTEPTTTTTAPVDEPVAEPAPETVDETTTTTTTPGEEPVGDPTNEPAPTTTNPPAAEPTEPTTTTTAPDGETDGAPATTTPTTTPTDVPDEEPAVDPTTESTAPVDEPVAGTNDDDDEATGTPSDDELSDAATVNETAQRDTEADDAEPPAPVDQPDAPAPPPIDTTPAELNTYDPGLRASSYDGVYAEGVPVGVAMATTRWLESGNRYDAQARGSSASGAYQIIDSTWNGYAGYPRAVLAPPEVQDQFSYESFSALLKRHGNDVSKIPVIWYIGHVPRGAEWDTVPKPEAGNVLTPRQYQAKWMKKFFSLLSEGAPVYLPSDTEALIPAIAFPVLGPVEFVDDWHFDRDGGARRHEGLDMLGYEGQPIRAVFDGVITKIADEPSGIAGNGLRLTRDDGLYANYFHLSDSETGPVHSSLEVGTRVRAGQIIGFMGSTGNAGIPHLHFELRTAEREPMAPYPAVMEAVQREQCTVGTGPWSTEFRSPAEKAEAEAAALKAFADLTDERTEDLLDSDGTSAAALEAFADLTDDHVEVLLDLADDEAAASEAFADLTDDQVDVLVDHAEAAAEAVEYLTIEGPDGAQWIIGTDGSVTASGQAAMIGAYQADCPMPIETTDEAGDPIMFGTDSEGLPVEELPVGWWDEEAVEWAPDLDDDDNYVDPWELDQAELDLASENHVDHADVEVRLTDRRYLKMI